MMQSLDLVNTVIDAAKKLTLKTAKSNTNILKLDVKDDMVEDAMESAMHLNGYGEGTDQEIGYEYMALAALNLARAEAVRVDCDIMDMS